MRDVIDELDSACVKRIGTCTVVVGVVVNVVGVVVNGTVVVGSCVVEEVDVDLGCAVLVDGAQTADR